MSPLHCDEACQERVKIAKKTEKGTPFLLGPDYREILAGEEINLVCNLYLGLGNFEEKKISWWHNSSLLTKEDMDDRKIVIENKILLDVTKESRLMISIANIADSGTYQCSTTEEVNKSPEVTLQVFLRKSLCCRQIVKRGRGSIMENYNIFPFFKSSVLVKNKLDCEVKLQVY